jgi:hypothetical protein
MPKIYLKAKYRITDPRIQQCHILCRTNEDTFFFFYENFFEVKFKEIPFCNYKTLEDYSNTTKYYSWAREYVEQALNGELKPFYTAESAVSETKQYNSEQRFLDRIDKILERQNVENN